MNCFAILKGEKYTYVNRIKNIITNETAVLCKDECGNFYFCSIDEWINNRAVELCRDVVGIYPMLSDETTKFLAIDLDEESWQEDVTAVRKICSEYNIPVSVERSRSGNGVHMWFFFEEAIPASTARKFGSGLLTKAMESRHEIKLDSYDRMFSTQDTISYRLAFKNLSRCGGDAELFFRTS